MKNWKNNIKNKEKKLMEKKNVIKKTRLQRAKKL